MANKNQPKRLPPLPDIAQLDSMTTDELKALAYRLAAKGGTPRTVLFSAQERELYVEVLERLRTRMKYGTWEKFLKSLRRPPEPVAHVAPAE